MGRLDDLFERHAAASLDKQQSLSDAIGEHEWELDLDAGTISFNQRYQFPVQILGTESEQTATWLWAWANRMSAIPLSLLSCAERLRHLGQQEQIAELREPRFPLSVLDGHKLALIASGLCNADCYYRGPYAGGAVFVLLRAPDIHPMAPCSAARINQIFTHLISVYSVNHRRTLLPYLEYARCVYRIEGSYLTARTHGGERFRVRFDREDRLVEWLNGTGGAATQG